MKVASFSNLPGYDRFDPIGLEFRSKTKAGNDHVFFWVPRFKGKSDRLFRWLPQSSSWREVPLSGLTEKKRAQLIQAWESQEDIGLWIAHSKRLDQRNKPRSIAA